MSEPGPMTTQDAREAILRVLEKHTPFADGKGFVRCGCTYGPDRVDLPLMSWLGWNDHLADALLDAIPTPAQVVGALEEDEHTAFYEENYSDWTVHALPLMVYVPMKDGDRDEALALVREILDEAAFDIRLARYPDPLALADREPGGRPSWVHGAEETGQR